MIENPTFPDWPSYEIHQPRGIDPCGHQERDFQGRVLEREECGGGSHSGNPLLWKLVEIARSSRLLRKRGQPLIKVSHAPGFSVEVLRPEYVRGRPEISITGKRGCFNAPRTEECLQPRPIRRGFINTVCSFGLPLFENIRQPWEELGCVSYTSEINPNTFDAAFTDQASKSNCAPMRCHAWVVQPVPRPSQVCRTVCRYHSAGSGTSRAFSIFYKVCKVIDLPARSRVKSLPSFTAIFPKVEVEISRALQCASIRSMICETVFMFSIYGLFPILSTGYFPRAISQIWAIKMFMDENWRERLENLLFDRGFNFRTLSAQAGVGETYVRDALKRNRMPTIDKFASIADTLGTSVEYLLSGEGEADTGALPVPVISWIAAGPMSQHNVVHEALDWIKVPGLKAGDWIALKVTGDSMDRISPPESTIVVNRKEKNLVPNACYVIADEDGSATYKRYRPGPIRFEPVSFNDAHEPIFPTNQPVIVGRVRKTMLDM